MATKKRNPEGGDPPLDPDAWTPEEDARDLAVLQRRRASRKRGRPAKTIPIETLIAEAETAREVARSRRTR